MKKLSQVSQWNLNPNSFDYKFRVIFQCYAVLDKY